MKDGMNCYHHDDGLGGGRTMGEPCKIGCLMRETRKRTVFGRFVVGPRNQATKASLPD
jgi:hypothetical protein